MSATALLEMAQRDGVQVGLSDNGRLKASGSRAALDRWLPELKARRPDIEAALCGATTALISRACPDGFSSRRWAVLCAGHDRFAREWADKAAGLGWTHEELFARHDPFANVSLQGAAWFIGDSTVVAVTADAITLRTQAGATQRFYRKASTNHPQPIDQNWLFMRSSPRAPA